MSEWLGLGAEEAVEEKKEDKELLNFRVGAARRGRRGAPRRGDGEQRAPKQAPKPNLQDANAFPSLS